MTETEYQLQLAETNRRLIELKAEAATAQLRVWKLEEALKFYAHPGRWQMSFTGEKDDPKFQWVSMRATTEDHGEIARKALVGDRK